MREIICNTSPIQYLHQLGLLHVLPAIARSVKVPPAVIEELNIGRRLGLNLPDLAAKDAIPVLDDVLARQVAETLRLPLTGTLMTLPQRNAKRYPEHPPSSPEAALSDSPGHGGFDQPLNTLSA